MAGRLWKVPARIALVVLVAAVWVAADGAFHARAGTGSQAPARFLDGPSEAMAAAQMRRARQVRQHRRHQRFRFEQAAAHARMPSTMYASTPDASAPPHPFPLDASLDSATGHATTAARVPARSASAGSARTHRLAFFPAAARWEEKGYQGFARIINRSDKAGAVRIEAWDDAGTRHGPVTLAIGAGETVHFNSDDLERGNAAKGLDGATGAGAGDWRLELSSALDLEALAYIRTRDGFLTAMHDVAPRGEAGHRVVIFNPGKNTAQASRLRVVNPGEAAAEVRIEGIDGQGRSPGSAVVVEVAAGASRTLSAAELESGGAGFTGALGRGSGKWRLVVSAEQAVEVMSLLASPTGHLTNLSTVPDNAEAGPEDATIAHTVGLFPAASRWTQRGYQGFARIINRSGVGGEVRIDAWDDAGAHRGPVTLAIGANETVHFNSDDLEGGNAGKGLSGGVGPPGTGDWRLRLSSGLELVVLAYIRTDDGFLTSMHDLAPSGEAGHRVVVFNPGKNTAQASRVRIVNLGDETAVVRIEGIDGRGESPGSAVELEVPAGASRTLGAAELESGGAGFTGGLGRGSGKWRLVVSADGRIGVMSLLSSPTGHLTNLSTVPAATAASETAAEVFREHISGPIVQGKCVNCHVAGGVSGGTRLVFVRSSESDHEARNLQTFERFIDEVDDGANYILNKIQGVAHGGGVQVAAGTADFTHMERFLRLLGEDVAPVTLTPQTLFDTVSMAPVRKTLRRAALIFAGRIPTDAEYAAAQRGAEALRATIRGLMTGPQFHEFLIRGANDRLLTDRDHGDVIGTLRSPFVDFINEFHRRAVLARADGDTLHRVWAWEDYAQHGARRAPLELIAHVVENDLPYTEILTADYIMANPWAAAAYGASEDFDHPEALANEFEPTRFVSYYREGDGFVREYDPVLGAAVVRDPGSLITDYPHAGILNTTAFLLRYPTTATNRNRARSRWTYYHFLGLDIEKSASRTTDPVALADTNNPTLRNPACTVCHRILDPVAGAFQNYGDVGHYKDQWGGVDSLDQFYKYDPSGGEDLLVSARSRERGVANLGTRRLFADQRNELGLMNLPTYDGDTKLHIGLGKVVVRDSDGRVVHRFETKDAVVDEDCGSSKDYGYKLWDCRELLVLPLKVSRDGTYRIEMEVWVLEQGTKAATLRIWMPGPFYREGDTWYRDMRASGFADERAPNPDNSVQWLARKIVADKRFAEATVKFWWPSIMGSEVAEPPADERDADFEGLLLAANAQGAEVTRLANSFRRGFHGRSAYNLKDLLVEIVLSKWFRADAVEDVHPVRLVALRDAGARRLLTPEELARKTAFFTGFQWGRYITPNCAPLCVRRPNALTEDYRLLYGGIDSDGITERTRDMTSVMAGVAKRHAVVVSCPVVMRELYLLPDAERRLFAGIDQHMTPESGANTIRNKLVELHDKLLGVQVTPYSPDVEAAYRLFVDVMERGREARKLSFGDSDCYWNWLRDLSYFDGILEDAVLEENGWFYFDRPRVEDFMHSINWRDPHYAAQSWAVVLAYLLTDYRYLYL